MDFLVEVEKTRGALCTVTENFKQLTQMRSWAIARLPSEAAKCNGVLESRGLTGLLTSSCDAWANTKATDFISDLK